MEGLSMVSYFVLDEPFFSWSGPLILHKLLILYVSMNFYDILWSLQLLKKHFDTFSWGFLCLEFPLHRVKQFESASSVRSLFGGGSGGHRRPNSCQFNPIHANSPLLDYLVTTGNFLVTTEKENNLTILIPGLHCRKIAVRTSSSEAGHKMPQVSPLKKVNMIEHVWTILVSLGAMAKPGYPCPPGWPKVCDSWFKKIIIILIYIDFRSWN